METGYTGRVRYQERQFYKAKINKIINANSPGCQPSKFIEATKANVEEIV